ncbi:MAG: O-antigen ligase family protein [Phycisphaerales bacterium]|jgi:O-antigen ligase|nr:O-antigen ligase family protein [Phycisphaerales bacterium]
MATSNRNTNFPRTIDADEPGRWLLLSRVALALILALVAARATMMEYQRDPFAVDPNSSPIPRGVGITTSIFLDLLCCVPALLVLTRRAYDPTFALVRCYSALPLGLLVGWAMLSTRWADDRFLTLITSTHLVAALAIIWATAQLVRTWRHIRLVAAIALGLLLAYAVHGAIYRYVELPDLQRSFQQNRTQIFAERGWQPDSFSAQQFERKITNGEMAGFSASPNTYAAATVMLAIVALGWLAELLRDRPIDGRIGLPIIALLSAGWIIYYTQSKAAMISPILGAGLLLFVGLFGPWLARRRRLVFVLSVLVILLGMLAVIGHGLYHGTLPSVSLAFRWKYWIASWEMFRAEHPWIGVGWANFGQHYLAYRLPDAPEEIKDPHNFIIRVLTELGIVGVIFLVAWLLRLWWELSRPSMPTSAPQHSRLSALRVIGAIGSAAILINIFASIDFSQGSAFAIIELFKRLLYLCAILIGAIILANKPQSQGELDDRSAPWLMYSVLIAAGIFLIHNLVDFSMFDTSVGPLLMLAMLIGAGMGSRGQINPRPYRRGLWIGLLSAVSVLWLTAWFLIAVPIAMAEASAQSGDDQLRANHPMDAARLYQQAMELSPVDNFDYAFRAARAMIFAGDSPAKIRQMIDKAHSLNPTSPDPLLMRAQFELRLPQPNLQQVIDDLSAALRLNPNDLTTREQYADVLATTGRHDDARREYDQTLWYNNQLADDEPRRLTPDAIARIEHKIQAL